jgi:excisionase family DNA binding protein
MTTKDVVLRLREIGAQNSEIAELLNVSRQYVSFICRATQNANERVKSPIDQDLLTVGTASRLLGVHQSTVRRWCDEGKIPFFRIDIGRGDRRIRLSDLQIFVKQNETITRVPF